MRPTQEGQVRGPTRNSKVRATAEWEGWPFLWVFWNNWNKLSASVVIATSVNIFKKRLEKKWMEIFTRLPSWLKPLLPKPYSPQRHQHTTENSYHFYMLPKSLFYICGFFRSINACLYTFYITSTVYSFTREEITQQAITYMQLIPFSYTSFPVLITFSCSLQLQGNKCISPIWQVCKSFIAL